MKLRSKTKNSFKLILRKKNPYETLPPPCTISAKKKKNHFQPTLKNLLLPSRQAITSRHHGQTKPPPLLHQRTYTHALIYILTGGEVPAGVSDALLGLEDGEELKGVGGAGREVAQRVRRRVSRQDARPGIARVVEALHAQTEARVVALARRLPVDHR